MKIVLFGWEFIVKRVDRLTPENVAKLAATYSTWPNKIHYIKAARNLTNPMMTLRDAKSWVEQNMPGLILY